MRWLVDPNKFQAPGDMREAGDQLRARNLTLSVGEIIQIKPRSWISDLL